MNFLIFAGLVALLFGIMFLFFPKTLLKWSESANRLITNIEDKAHNYRIGVGVSLILISIMCLFVAYYIKVKYIS